MTKKVIQRLCEVARTLNIPITDFYMQIGISRAVFYNKDALPNAKTLIKIADAYNVSIDYLLGYSKDMFLRR